jgi:hypothetical protein
MHPLRSAGVVASKSVYIEIKATRETLQVRARDSQPDSREGQAGPGGGKVRSSDEAG